MFSMKRTEMVALVQLSRQMGEHKRLTQKMVGELSEQTRNNLIDFGNTLWNQRLVNNADLKTTFPGPPDSSLDDFEMVYPNLLSRENASTLMLLDSSATSS